MSRDWHLLIDAAVTAQTIRDNLVNAHGFTPNSNGWLIGAALNAVVTPSTKDDEFLAEPGIAKPTVTVSLMPRRLPSRDVATRAIFALTTSLLRTFSGDAALTVQDASTCILRVNGVVHVDRNQVPEERLTADDMAPSPLIVGIPAIAE